MGQNTVAAQPPCVPKQEPSTDLSWIPQQREKEEKNWAQQVEQEQELQKRMELQRRVLEEERQGQEGRQVLQAPQEEEKEESHQEAISALRETVDSLTEQLEAFQAQMRRAEESVSSRNYKQHLQEHGGLSQFWERELESLHFVIEMRNIRVRELDKRLALAEAMREQNLALEEKVCALQQENEDLCARFRKQVAISRQLSEDLLATRQALEKETRLRQDLQQEKEELVFRVLGAQADQSFPLARTAPTPTQVPFLAT